MPRTKTSLRKDSARPERPFASIEQAVEDVRAGRIIILVDDEGRENEGDFYIAAERCTPEAVNFMTKEGRGLVCLALMADQVDRLGLPMMVPAGRNGAPFSTAFTVSIEARQGVTTGISAHDRALTIKTAIRPDATASDLVTPGHVFPLRAQPGGVLRRAGHTEGAVDLARLAGLSPSGVVCEILREDGSMARVPDLVRVAKRHHLSLVTIKDLIAYRMRHERLVERIEEAVLPTEFGEFRAVGYLNRSSGRSHLALVLGEVDPEVSILTRVQPAESLPDFLSLLRSDCTDRVRYALAAIQREGRGVFVYLKPDMMGEEFRRRNPAEETGAPETAGAGGVKRQPITELRDYGIGAQILADLGLRRIRIMTNDERRIVALEGYGLQLEGRVPIEIEAPLLSCGGEKKGPEKSLLMRR